ncbi:MAG: flagellar assembly protein FliX [Rhodospirillaceae bacterium]
MKIAGTGPVPSSSPRRRSQSGGASEGTFAERLTSSRPAAGAGQAGPVGGMEGLLAIQEVDDEGRRRRRAREHGEAVLDRLDEIRHALLTGSLNPDSLQRLLRQVRRERADFDDPGLRGILDEIELRAAVELAKLGRAA